MAMVIIMIKQITIKLMKARQIHIPLLHKYTMITAYAQQRPRRNGGYLIQKDYANNKIVIHNYGHGGAGVSLAPGSAQEAVELASQYLNQDKFTNIAVIGSGIIGLFTASMIAKKYPKIKIRIYADRVPVFGQKNNEKLITSQVAPGLWFPYHSGRQNDDKNKRVTLNSFKQYQILAKSEDYKHIIKQVNVFDISDDKQIQEEYSNNLPEQVKDTYHKQLIRINDKVTLYCQTFKTFKIDMQPFLNKIINKLLAQGVIFINKYLDKDNFSQLNQTLIFNCAGLGSRELFNDKSTRGVKGHLLEYNNPNPEKYNSIITANIGKQVIDYYMHESRIILGLTQEEVDDCKIDINQVKMLQEAHQKVMAKYSLIQLPHL